MVSTFSANKGIEEPAAGDYPGAWAPPVNTNWTVIDQCFGTIQVIDLSGGSMTLSQAQARSPFINFSGALPGNVFVTIPGLSTSPGTIVSGGFYSIENLCSNSSQFSVTLVTTVAGQEFIGIPPHDKVDIMVEGTNSSQAGSIKFRNLGRIGSYWDYAGSSVPSWVANCAIPPYLNCDGSAFSAVTYPALASILGGTTLPDARGRYRAVLNQGTARITTGSSTGGVDGDTKLATGGSQVTTLSSQNMPPVQIIDPSHTHTPNSGTTFKSGDVGAVGPGSGVGGAAVTIAPAVTGITAGTTAPTNFSNLPPSYIGGLTLIRAA